MKTQIEHIAIIIFHCFVLSGFGQTLDAEKGYTIQLSDGIEVNVFKKASSFDETANQYYYLPSNMRFGRTPSNELEFSLMSYKDQKELHGGILHFLVQWGLNKEQLQETDSILKASLEEDAVLMGAVLPNYSEKHDQLIIEGNTELAEILNASEHTIGKITTIPNAKSAASFKLSAENTEKIMRLLQTNSDTLKEIFISMIFNISFKNNGTQPSEREYILTKNLHELLNL